MGLDAVEIVLRAEEFYSVSFTDEEAARVTTIHDLYTLICSKLGLSSLPSPETAADLPKVAEYERSFLILRRRTPLPPPPDVLPWTSQAVWDTLVAILVDQQCLKPDDVLPGARFVEDLGVD